MTVDRCPCCGRPPAVDLSNVPFALRIERMIHWVAARTDITPVMIKGPRRQVDIVRARWAVAWAARRAFGSSLSLLGRVLGHRDHATIFHGLRVAEDLRREHLPFRELSDALLAAFTPTETKEQVQ